MIIMSAATEQINDRCYRYFSKHTGLLMSEVRITIITIITTITITTIIITTITIITIMINNT